MGFEIDIDPPGQPVSFTVKGHTVDGGEWSEAFTALPAIPAGAMVDLGNGLMPTVDAARFIGSILVEADVERWEALIRDKERIVSEVALAKILTHVFAGVSGRPIVPLESSSSGPGDTGASSTGGSSSPVTASTT